MHFAGLGSCAIRQMYAGKLLEREPFSPSLPELLSLALLTPSFSCATTSLLSHHSHFVPSFQLQICYDMQAAILYVTVIRAKNLVSTNHGLPDPFVKCYLLPPRM